MFESLRRWSLPKPRRRANFCLRTNKGRNKASQDAPRTSKKDDFAPVSAGERGVSPKSQRYFRGGSAGECIDEQGRKLKKLGGTALCCLRNFPNGSLMRLLPHEGPSHHLKPNTLSCSLESADAVLLRCMSLWPGVPTDNAKSVIARILSCKRARSLLWCGQRTHVCRWGFLSNQPGKSTGLNRTRARAHTHTHIHTHARTHARTHAHAHTRTHAHTRMGVARPRRISSAAAQMTSVSAQDSICAVQMIARPAHARPHKVSAQVKSSAQQSATKRPRWLTKVVSTHACKTQNRAVTLKHTCSRAPAQDSIYAGEMEATTEAAVQVQNSIRAGQLISTPGTANVHSLPNTCVDGFCPPIARALRFSDLHPSFHGLNWW